MEPRSWSVFGTDLEWVSSMRHSLPRASGWHTKGMALFVLALAAALASPNVAMEGPERLEECESPLRRLITLLESRHQLTGTKERYKGRALGSDYSKCRVIQEGRPWPQYAVFRSSDDITLVIEKRLGERHDPVLYGPFRSAYRK